MKLSLARRWGFQRCDAGVLVRVVTEHAVRTSTADVSEPDREEAWVFAQVGDLAVEIVERKSRALIGHAYLSGPAIRLHRYGPPTGAWYEPASARFVTLPHPRELEVATIDDLLQRMMPPLMDLKFADADVAGFVTVARSKKDGQNALSCLSEMLSMRAQDETRPQRAELFGHIRSARGRTLGALHLQARETATEGGATPFAIALAVRALEHAQAGTEHAP